MANMPQPTPQSGKPGEAKPAGAPGAAPAEPKKGSAVGKLIKFVLLVGVLGAGGSMWWHGKKLGEEQKIDGVKWPWTWNTQEWEGWYGKVEAAADKAGTALAAKTQAAKSKLDQWRADRAAKAGTTPTTPTTPTGTPPANPTTPTTPGDTPPATPTTPTPPADGAAVPEGWKEIADLVNAGGEAWEKHDYATAKTKLTEAKAKIDPIMAKTPVHPEVQKAHDLTRDLLEDISMR